MGERSQTSERGRGRWGEGGQERRSPRSRSLNTRARPEGRGPPGRGRGAEFGPQLSQARGREDSASPHPRVRNAPRSPLESRGSLVNKWQGKLMPGSQEGRAYGRPVLLEANEQT